MSNVHFPGPTSRRGRGPRRPQTFDSFATFSAESNSIPRPDSHYTGQRTDFSFEVTNQEVDFSRVKRASETQKE